MEFRDENYFLAHITEGRKRKDDWKGMIFIFAAFLTVFLGSVFVMEETNERRMLESIGANGE